MAASSKTHHQRIKKLTGSVDGRFHGGYWGGYYIFISELFYVIYYGLFYVSYLLNNTLRLKNKCKVTKRIIYLPKSCAC